MKVKHAIAKSIKVLGLCLMTGALTLVVLWGCTTERGGRGPVVEDARSRSSAGANVKKSTPARTQSAAKLVQTPVEEGYYRVVRGDTLFSIAFRYGQDYRTLAAQNGIEAPYNITEGQLLKVGKSAPSYSAVRTKPQTAAPAAASSSSAAAAADKRIIHVVKKGETLSSVGRQHNIAPSSIVRINKLKAPYTLIPGQILNVNPAADQAAYPQQAAAAPAAASVKQSAAPAAPDSAARAERTEQDLLKAKSNLPAASAPAAAATSVAAAAPAQASGSKAQSKNESKPQPQTQVQPQPKATESAAVSDTAAAAPVVVPGKTRKVGGVQWMWPAKGKVIKGFSSGEHGNKGLDISGSRGQNILSAADGQVVYAGNALRGYGNLIIINHDNEYLSAYAHNERLLVKEGATVKRGQVVATMGSTDADSVRLHFEIRYRGKSINPTGCLPKQ
ncbi:MAG: peptidoglycan DD-metalloendopeptidase family protein [Succinivibrio sp.]|nr:peptidoglycan DD-metalloendopeptidase family protein [Succinivibrio sp.]